MERLQFVVIFYPLLLFCLSFHEAAHAWVADRLGDDTAKLLGRITLNPLPHMDFLGTLFLPLVALFTGAPLFGWGKPVPVNPYRFKNPRRGNLWVAAAGPASNLVLALLFALLFRGTLFLIPQVPPEHLQDGKWLGDLTGLVLGVCQIGVRLNLVLAFFNLIPLFPLDGGSVLRGIIPSGMVEAYDRFSRYSMLILLMIFISGQLSYILIPVNLLTAVLLN